MATIKVEVKETGLSKTERDLEKLRKTGGKTEKQLDGMSKKAKSFGQNASAAISAIDGPFGGVASRVSALTTVLTSGTAAMTGFALAVSAVGASLTAGAIALDEYEIGLKRTQAILNSTGNAAGFTAEQLRQQADELARATLTSTQQVQRAQAILLTFNRVTTDTFTKAIELSQDLAESGFGSITSNAVQLGKALQDPTTGLTALTRVGITFSESQKDLVKSLQDSNQLLEAQQIIISQLEQQVGGAGAAVAVDTIAGSWDSFTDALEKFNVQAAQTTGINVAIRAVLNQTTKDIDSLTEAFNRNSRSRFNELLEDRLKLQEQLADLEDDVGFSLGFNDASINRVKDNIAEVEAELIRIQDAEKARQKAIADAQEASRKKQADLEEQGRKDREAAEQAARDKQIAREKAAQDKINANALAALELRLMTDEERLTAKYQRELALIGENNELKLALEQEYQDSLKEIRQKESDGIQTIQAAYSGYAAARVEADKLLTEESEKASKEQRRTALNQLDQSTQDLATAFGEQSGIYRATASVNALIKTYEAANAAYAALAPIPIVGPGLGIAAAAAATTAGLANVAAINSARAQGGQFNAGDNVLVGERGPEVVSFGSGGRVTSNADIRSGSGITVVNNVYNQAEGVSVTQKENSTGGTDTYIRREDLPGAMAAVASDASSDFQRTNMAVLRDRGF